MRDVITGFCGDVITSMMLGYHTDVSRSLLDHICTKETLNLCTSRLHLHVETYSIFLVLHGMPAQTSDEKGVHPSVRLSVRQMCAL